MQYNDLIDFQRVVRESVRNACADQTAHKDTATFTVGDSTVGYGLCVDRYGWVQLLNRVRIAGRDHIASPLANLQAAAAVICS